jgi:hypothetical protein
MSIRSERYYRRWCEKCFYIGTIITVRPSSYFFPTSDSSVGKFYRPWSRRRTPASANLTDVGVSVGLQRRLSFPTSTQGIENIRRVYNATFRGILGRRNSAKVHFRVASFHGVSADVNTMTSLYFIRVFNSL